jgi:hypothetical protein
MIKKLRNFINKFRYKTVDVLLLTVTWTDKKYVSTASVALMINGFGKRKAIKYGSLYPVRHEDVKAWHTKVIPFLHGRARLD